VVHLHLRLLGLSTSPRPRLAAATRAAETLLRFLKSPTIRCPRPRIAAAIRAAETLLRLMKSPTRSLFRLAAAAVKVMALAARVDLESATGPAVKVVLASATALAQDKMPAAVAAAVKVMALAAKVDLESATGPAVKVVLASATALAQDKMPPAATRTRGGAVVRADHQTRIVAAA
jgi:hypothetical protein